MHGRRLPGDQAPDATSTRSGWPWRSRCVDALRRHHLDRPNAPVLHPVLRDRQPARARRDDHGAARAARRGRAARRTTSRWPATRAATPTCSRPSGLRGGRDVRRRARPAQEPRAAGRRAATVDAGRDARRARGPRVDGARREPLPRRAVPHRQRPGRPRRLARPDPRAARRRAWTASSPTTPTPPWRPAAGGWNAGRAGSGRVRDPLTHQVPCGATPGEHASPGVTHAPVTRWQPVVDAPGLPSCAMEQPHVVVLFGATGDLARRKLLPGLLHLFEAGLLEDCRIVGTSLDDLDTEQFVKLAREAVDEFSRPFDEACWDDVRRPMLASSGRATGPQALADAVARGRGAAGPGVRRARSAGCTTSACRPRPRSTSCTSSPRPDLVERSRIIMEKPFGTDLESAKKLNARLHEVFARGADLPDRPLPRQGGGAEHPGVPVRQRPVRADLEPQLHRPRADRRAGDARPRDAGLVLRVDRRVPRHGRHPPDAGARVHGDGAADVAGAGTDQRREAQGVPLDASAGAAQRGARAVPRLPRPSTRSPTTPTPRRSWR